MIKKIAGWIVIAFGVFLMADAILSLLLGERYLLWGLEYTPDAYRALIERVAGFPPAILSGIKLGEGIVGFVLFWTGRKRLSPGTPLLYCGLLSACFSI